MFKLLSRAAALALAASLACSDPMPGPPPTAAPAPTPSASGPLAPIDAIDYQAFMGSVTLAEEACLAASIGPNRLRVILRDGAASEAYEWMSFVGCLESESLLRLFLHPVLSVTGPLSADASACIRGGLELAAADAMTGGLSSPALFTDTFDVLPTEALYAALACMNQEELIAADSATRNRQGETLQLLCVIGVESLGRPERAAPLSQGSGRVSNVALRNAMEDCAASATPTPSPRTSGPLANLVWDTAAELAEDVSPRESATEEELRAAHFLARQFSEWEYEVEIQGFETMRRGQATRLAILTPVKIDVVPGYRPGSDGEAPWMYSDPLDPISLTASEEYAITGELAYAGRGDVEDFNGVDMRGKIALMERGGGLSMGEKVERAAEAGAVAAVIFNENETKGSLYFFERIFEDTTIPAIGLNNDRGRALALALEGGAPLEVKVQKTPLFPLQSRNVIAELNNDIADDKTLIVGAHFDTTPLSSGANDNGSGVAAALVLARQLSGVKLPFDLIFVLFGAEETGLNGSYAYVEGMSPQDKARVMAMINLDSVGAGNLIAVGSDEMLRLAAETAADTGIALETVAFSDEYTSDQLPFMLAGMDWLYIFADDLTSINAPEDTLERLQRAPIVHATKLTLAVVERLAERER